MLTSGTDANVYFQLIGSEGETETIQLRQGGKAEKRFEKGRVSSLWKQWMLEWYEQCQS